jgi:hypothetical protein
MVSETSPRGKVRSGAPVGGEVAVGNVRHDNDVDVAAGRRDLIENGQPIRELLG